MAQAHEAKITAFCVQDGCVGDPFKHISTTGEYQLYCRPSVITSRSKHRARSLKLETV